MHQLTTTSQTVTMTSLELVDYINSERDAEMSALRHDSFMAKVPKVLGANAPKFIGTQAYGNNNTREIYTFPKREACLMAMSYSYDLQAKVYDEMTAREQAAPRSPAEMFLAMAQQMVANEQRITGLDNRVAKIEGKQAAQDQVKTVLEFALAHGMSTDKETLRAFGVRASRASRLMGYDIETKHQDHKNYRGNVNAYHPDVLFAIVEETA